MKKKTPSAEDSTLFRQAVGKVTKVTNDKVALNTAPKPKPYPKNQFIEHESPLQRTQDFSLETLSHEDKQSFLLPGMQKNVLKKLRKGHYGIDASIDLHGLTSHHAQQQLTAFLHRCVENGKRCVHVIHGKGYRSQNHLPVLKNDVNLWLRQHHDVLAFCSAPQKEGGTGAVIVLLRLAEKYGEQDDTQY